MTTGRRILGEVGVEADAEDVYRMLLANPGLSSTELSERAIFAPGRLESALAQLEELAMVTRLSGRPVRFQPTPPDIVVEALISSREEELQRAWQRTRLDARALLTLRQLHSDQVKATEIVEVLTNSQGVAQRWNQVQTVTQRSLEVFVRPPFAQQRFEDDEELQSRLRQRGVQARGIYDQAALAVPGMLEHAWRMVSGGEKVRVVTELPMKLALSDRQIGLVPLMQDEDPESAVDAGLMVHKSALLDALIALFDSYWERGTEIRPGVVPTSSPEGKASDDQVVALMLSGLKDSAIARQLGVSVPTVRRRIRAVQRHLGVTTRFQAGYALGRQKRPESNDED